MTEDFNPKTVIRIAMLPPSFSEFNLFKFFSQFGPVLRVKVARSPKTMRTCGYGYVQFDDPVVAYYAAIAMDGYLVANAILRVYQLEKGKQGLLRPVRPSNCKEKFISKTNIKLTEEARVQLIEKLNSVRANWVAKLSASGIAYDAPEVLLK